MSVRPPRSTATSLWGVALTIVLTAAVLRSPIVAVAPVARDIQADLDVSAGVVGLLTSIPVLAFAVCAPLAVMAIRRLGPDAALSLALAGAVIASIVRSAGGLPAVILGTALLGVFLTVGNVVVPLIIKREFPPERVPWITSLFTSAMNVGTMTVTLATAPIAAVTDWRVAIAVWGGFGLAALVVWVGIRRGEAVRAAPEPVTTGAAGRPDGRGRAAALTLSTWLLALAFAGQAFAFYGTTAWLPSLLIDGGMPAVQAGAVAAIFQVMGVAGALLTPVLTRRFSAAPAAVIIGAGWLAIPLGFLLAPDGWLAWCLVGGLAQGAGITWVFIMLNGFGGDERVVAGRSGTVQGIGYAAGALAPPLLGGVHDATGDWTPALLLLLGAVVVLLVTGAVGARIGVREARDRW
ncbi:MFS transporter [Microbacterium sp. ET2]|uniref:MFS transporter n=1 Tax=Microbacterium albipurpureum TaxID=3050384 RepID=UPI00259C98E9|nr:MFS transporter [Microbacterium sp. ET2 (Ac-2212)]WJL94429.1 MFS transporter [Microbacterium sp. ET2 (Ac-2212)]